jgi:hypothetical protein
MARLSTYQKLIAEILVLRGRREIDPRHIEGYIRLAHPTLDGLSAEEFRLETDIGIGCIDAAGVEQAERNARSFGL